MNILRVLILVMPMLMLGHAHAGQQEYDDCLLKHLKNAKHDIATHMIRQACYGNYYKPSFTSEKRRAYNDCLLEHLVGVESFDAVMEISAACDRKTR